jgi:phage shock protein PspC (stress-responsive transcriptional regulator)
VNEEIKSQSAIESGQASSPRRLYRSAVNRRIAGVCGGVAEYLNIDPLVVRLVWFVSIFINGIGLFAYIAAWIIVPENPQPAAAPPQTKSTSSRYIWGTILIVLGVIFLAEEHNWDFWRWRFILPYWLNWGVFFSVLVILLGLLLIFRGDGGWGKSSGIATSSEIPPEATTGIVGSPDVGERKMDEKRLTRALDERMIGGVCGGLAKYFKIDPSFVRIGWVLLTFFSGFVIGIVTYIVMMIVIPEESPAPKNTANTISHA